MKVIDSTIHVVADFFVCVKFSFSNTTTGKALFYTRFYTSWKKLLFLNWIAVAVV